jgi:hypothetical protein
MNILQLILQDVSYFRTVAGVILSACRENISVVDTLRQAAYLCVTEWGASRSQNTQAGRISALIQRHYAQPYQRARALASRLEATFNFEALLKPDECRNGVQ